MAEHAGSAEDWTEPDLHGVRSLSHLTDFAARYVLERNLRARTPIHSAARFVRFLGDVAISDITESHLISYRAQCSERGLSPKTTESSIGNIITLIYASTGHRLARGRRLRIPHPEPRPVSIDTIQLTWQHASPWIRQWIVLSYWTALRLGDSLRLLLSLTADTPDVLRLTASKTGHSQAWPVPAWLRIHLKPVPLRFCANTDFSRRLVRRGICSATMSAGIPCWDPKFLRQRSLTEWSRANGMAGAIIHGSGLSGVMRHYIDPLTVLESAAFRVRLPICFGATVSESEQLLSSFARLDPGGQRLICETAERLAAG